MMFRALFAWVNKYERHLSATAMVAGFVADNLFFGRVDLWQTQLVFIAYTAICFVSIPLLHWLETRGERTGYRPRWRGVVPLATQFALGGFWSGFVVFYGRSAAIGASWPFLLILLAIFLGNEILSKYHERLVFTAVLFFFALYSYAIFALPIYTHAMGPATFIESGAAAIVLFGLFTILLRIVGRERFRADVFWIRAGAVAVLIFINVCYFTNVLPPLPLAAKAAGVYHLVEHGAGGYTAETETPNMPLFARYFGYTPTLHITTGGSVYAYTSVFAPTELATLIIHRWEWFNPATKAWETRFALSYPIEGGADGGYAGYSGIVPKVAGVWRVSVETADGRVIARLPFTVAFASSTPALSTIQL